MMFPQIICSTQLDTSCLQQSSKTKTRYICLSFEKNITRCVRRRFYEVNVVGVPCKRAQHNIVALRFAGHRTNHNTGTCWAKSLTGFRLYATSANNIVVVPCKRTQQITTLLGPKVLGVVGQPCWIRLHGPLHFLTTIQTQRNRFECFKIIFLIVYITMIRIYRLTGDIFDKLRQRHSTYVCGIATLELELFRQRQKAK